MECDAFLIIYVYNENDKLLDVEEQTRYSTVSLVIQISSVKCFSLQSPKVSKCQNKSLLIKFPNFKLIDKASIN